MERTKFAAAPCSIARSLDVLGDWWNPLIVRECLYGIHRFEDFQRWLGIGRNILTKRLTLLLDEGLLEKRKYQDNPERFEYHLTDKGYDAAIVLLAVMPFGEKWYFDRDKEPIRLYDRRSGRQVTPVVADAETGEPVDPRNLYAGPGPSFPNDAHIQIERFTEYFAGRRTDRA
ncbi:MAG: helix-turn-helix domain-containing protein [Woeseiaceae bacterium]|nr:helix-turn-helix domain-containing protein [Woeseiaceae bacterium]